MSLNIFSHDLRQFRIENKLTRNDAASILNVSASTLRRWEDGRATPQSATLWGIIERLNSPSVKRLERYGDIQELKAIIEKYARSIDLSPVESFRSRLIGIERTLSSTILRASQTDFRFDPSTELLRPEPFVEDLELFDVARDRGLKDLIETTGDAATEILPKLDNSNIEQRYFADSLRVYADQCRRMRPNPRILERKGSLIRFVLNSEGIENAVNAFLLKEIEQFVEYHNELMRGYFGSALAVARDLNTERVRDNIISYSPSALVDAVVDLERYVGDANVDGGQVSPEAAAILSDVSAEVKELADAVGQTNDPSLRALRLARAKVASVHGALFLGRLIYRAAGASLEYGSQAATVAMLVEMTSPGTLRAAYETLRISIPDLPPLPVP